MSSKNDLTPSQLRLAGALLREASHVFSKHGCSDFDVTEFLSQEEYEDLLRQYHDWNGDPYEYPNTSKRRSCANDWMLMGYLGAKLMEPNNECEHSPIPLILTCPCCGGRHIDEGEFATKSHHTHACQECGMCWRPAIVHTVGVRFLPGFKNP